MKNSSFASDRDWQIDIAGDKSEFKSCQLIHTVTCSREAILDVADVDLDRPLGVHITAVGSDSAGKRELSVELLKEAGKACDSRSQSLQRGEFQHLSKIVEDNGQGPDSIKWGLCELGELIEKCCHDSEAESGEECCYETRGRKFLLKEGVFRAVPNPSWRPDPECRGLTVFDTSGVAVQDAAMAELLEEFL